MRAVTQPRPWPRPQVCEHACVCKRRREWTASQQRAIDPRRARAVPPLRAHALDHDEVGLDRRLGWQVPRRACSLNLWRPTNIIDLLPEPFLRDLPPPRHRPHDTTPASSKLCSHPPGPLLVELWRLRPVSCCSGATPDNPAPRAHGLKQSKQAAPARHQPYPDIGSGAGVEPCLTDAAAAAGGS
jgi:hypothetical protein